MSAVWRALRWLLVGVAAALALVVAGFVAERVATADRIARSVFVGTVDVSGLTGEEARDALDRNFDRLVLVPVEVDIEGRTFLIDPREAGARVDLDAAIVGALEARRRGWFGAQAVSWAKGLLGDRVTLEWGVTVDAGRVDAILATWDPVVGATAREGDVRIAGGLVEPVYPEVGRAVDREGVTRDLPDVIGRLPRPPLAAALVETRPQVTAMEVDATAGEARRYLTGPLELSSTVTATVEAAALAATLVVLADGGDLRIAADPDALVALLRQGLPGVERPARDATWATDGDTVRVVPGEDGLTFDATATAGVLLPVLDAGPRRLEPVLVHTEPGRTTEEARALGITRRVATFTTEHPAGQPRVANIHRIADTVNGVIVLPGDGFSVNTFVGPRTKEKGYVEAPVIYDDEYQSDVGGGVSQFATTFYNALYFGGYQIDAATPHGFYISRYPPGREATLSYPDPDLVFTNDTAAGVLVRTAYTETSITVSLYGDHGGRVVESIASERRDLTEGGRVARPDPGVPPGVTRRLQERGGGFTIDVTRVTRYPDGSVVRETDTVVYGAPDEILLFNPADPVPAGYVLEA